MPSIKFETPDVENFLRLRKITGLSPRSEKAARIGLHHSLFAVTIFNKEIPIGMGRVVGDGGLNFEIVDVAVDPEYQGQGFGSQIMTHIMRYLDENAPEGCYISLIADVPTIYEKFGFKRTSPNAEGMYLRK